MFMVVSTWGELSRKDELQAAETATIARLQREGFIVQGFQRSDGGGGFTVVVEQSLEAAQARLRELPFVQNGVLRLDLFAVTPRAQPTAG
ncbi:hypothetical protein CJ179_01650 [Rhodococcus sp. ACS1]|nr:hypothetical protein CJ179_01650 [Rhodococcus sp. ACS1]